SGLVTVDSALNRGATSHEELHDLAGRFAHWQGARTAKMALGLSDGRAESAGESRARYLFWRFNVPRPALQHEIVVDGRVVARTDFGWIPYRHVGEFDGRIKYQPAMTDDPSATVFNEKRREDLIRRQALGMSRLTW